MWHGSNMKCLNAYFVTIIILLSTISSVSWALPDCPSSGYFHNCFGTFRHESGYEYVGEWKDNLQHGQGTATWSNGEKYEGEYRNGKKHGQGISTWSTPHKSAGEKYIGEYRNGKKHGQGISTWSSPSKYVGFKYVGEFRHDKRNGQGKMTYPDGKIEEGIWKDDIFQFAQKKPSNGANSNSKLNKYKEFCEEIRFKLGTEKFADCVLKAMEKD